MKTVNDCICCSVRTCAYHDALAQHCTLESIQVGCDAASPKSSEHTECASFAPRNQH